MKNEELPKILIVDDRPENLVAIKRVLSDLNAELMCASSGNETLALTIVHRFSLILLDVMMPDMDGFETAELLRQNDSTKQIPIIFVTAISKEKQHIFKGYQAGAVDYILKPFTPEILRSKVSVFLKLFEQQRQLERSLLELHNAEKERIKFEEARRRVEELEKLSVLAGGIAHDFNNLLTAILGNINLASYTLPQGHKAASLLSAAERASLIAQKLTKQLLIFAKGVEPLKEVASVGEVVRKAVASVLRGSSVSCRFDIDDNLWSAEIDKELISQVIQNLVVNSDYSLSQGDTIEVFCQNYLKEHDDANMKAGKYIEIAVRDTGCGVPAQYMSQIFDPYFTTKEKDSCKGSGLGLATAHSIICRHDGFIKADSVEGEGSVFTFYLPALGADSPVTNKKAENISYSQGRILVMDDDEMIIKMMGMQLKNLGYESEVVTNGQQALDLYRKEEKQGNHFDAVIMDLTIPGGMGGLETMEKLLVEYADAVVLISSGDANVDAMTISQRRGFKGVLTKPFTMQQLGDALHDALHGD